MFPGFTLERVDIGDVQLRVRHGGRRDATAVVLLHGHPRTHTTWYAVAPLLAADFYVVCPDLRGYGESSKPADEPDHRQASKRAMARDLVTLMNRLGFERFAVVGHDRGAYAAMRTAMDHPERVSHLIVLDAIPIGEALGRATSKFAQAWPHWFFFGLPDKPERAILCDPDGWYSGTAEAMGEHNFADYRRAIHDAATVHAMVEDYRAGLTADRADDETDMTMRRQLKPPTLVLWATRDDLEFLYGDPLDVWRNWSSNLDGRAIESGHHMAEEVPDELAAEIRRFIGTG